MRICPATSHPLDTILHPMLFMCIHVTQFVIVKTELPPSCEGKERTGLFNLLQHSWNYILAKTIKEEL